jgi:hypothetical protein
MIVGPQTAVELPPANISLEYLNKIKLTVRSAVHLAQFGGTGSKLRTILGKQRHRVLLR